MRFATIFAAILVVFALMFVRPQTINEDDSQTQDPHHEDHDEDPNDAKETTLSPTRIKIVDKIRKMFDSIKNVTDPIASTNWRIDIPENQYVNGKLEMVVVFLFGQANVALSKFSYDESLSELKFGLTWKKHVVFMTTNNNQITIGNNKNAIVEKSQIRVVLTGLELNGTAIVRATKISDLSIVTKVAASLFTMTDFLNDSYLSVRLGNALTNYFPQFLENNVEIISGILSPILEKAINFNL